VTAAVIDPRDAAAFRATPTVMAPRFGALEEIAVGAKRFVAGTGGLFLEVRSPAMHVCVPICRAPLPYGEVSPFVRLTVGPVPVQLIRDAINVARANCLIEIALAISLSPSKDGYESLPLPSSRDSAVSVSYLDIVEDDDLCFDFHSHGVLDSYFSSVDDASDLSRRGPYFAVVIGNCAAGAPTTLCARFCCAPFLIDMSFDQLFDMGVIA
jgi:PRTRC genetic system protein A